MQARWLPRQQKGIKQRNTTANPVRRNYLPSGGPESDLSTRRGSKSGQPRLHWERQYGRSKPEPGHWRRQNRRCWPRVMRLPSPSCLLRVERKQLPQFWNPMVREARDARAGQEEGARQVMVHLKESGTANERDVLGDKDSCHRSGTHIARGVNKIKSCVDHEIIPSSALLSHLPWLIGLLLYIT